MTLREVHAHVGSNENYNLHGNMHFFKINILIIIFILTSYLNLFKLSA